MRPYILPLILLLAAIPAAGTDGDRDLAEKAKQARTLFKQQRYSEAAALARQVFVQQRVGRASDELRILLCKAKAAGEDVGDSGTAYRNSGAMGADAVSDSPEKVAGAQPQFRRARRNARPGEMIVAAEIDEDGCVQDLKVTRSLNPEADQDALDAFREWVFRPATLYGLPIRLPTEWVVNVTFDRS